jgi:hypothetical protein
MPSMLHELLVLLFRNRPELIADLLRASNGAEWPKRVKARIGSAEFTDIQPAQYQADLVVVLEGKTGKYGIVVEVQLSIDRRKRYTWPVYVTSLRAQLRCPVSVVVVTPNEAVARWAAKRVTLGHDNDFAPLVVSPSVISQMASRMQASGDPELSTLFAIMHNYDRDSRFAMAAVIAALRLLRDVDTDVSKLYSDLLEETMGDAVLEQLKKVNQLQYDPKGVIARLFIANGRVSLLIHQLTTRFGPLPEDVRAYLKRASARELERVSERVLTATTLSRALGSSYRRSPRVRKARVRRARA